MFCAKVYKLKVLSSVSSCVTTLGSHKGWFEPSHQTQSILVEEKPPPVSRNQQGTSNITFHVGLKEGNSTYGAGKVQSSGWWWSHKVDIPIPPTTHKDTPFHSHFAFFLLFSTNRSCILCPPSIFIPLNSKRLFETEQNRSQRSSLKRHICEEQQSMSRTDKGICNLTLKRKYVSVSLTIPYKC